MDLFICNKDYSIKVGKQMFKNLHKNGNTNIAYIKQITIANYTYGHYMIT